MKALTVRQPWASQIIAGEKTIEWRACPIRFRGWLAIHAASKPAHPTLPCGVIIGQVSVVHCEYVNSPPHAGWHWAWHLAEPAEWEHVPAIGNVGLWNAEEGIAKARNAIIEPNLFGWVKF
jgi:ASCH domain